MVYGLCENSETFVKENLLPLGLMEGAKLKRDVKKDEILTFNDVELDETLTSVKLWREQLDDFKE